MNENIQTPSDRSSKSNTGKNSVPGIILRLILVLITGIIIGLVIYFSALGWIPYIEQRVFEPIENNQTELNYLKATQQSLEEQIINLQSTNLTQQSTLESLNSDLNLNTDFRSLRATVEMGVQLVSEQNILLATLDARQGSADNNLSALATAQINRLDLEYDLGLLKILDSLILTNQYLAHANLGEAEDQLELVKVELESLYTKAQVSQQAVLSNLLDLVTETIEDLPGNPSLAENKVELAILTALQGFPDPSQDLTLTPTPYSTPTGTSTP